jgi:hypothetical protein
VVARVIAAVILSYLAPQLYTVFGTRRRIQTFLKSAALLHTRTPNALEEPTITTDTPTPSTPAKNSQNTTNAIPETPVTRDSIRAPTTTPNPTTTNNSNNTSNSNSISRNGNVMPNAPSATDNPIINAPIAIAAPTVAYLSTFTYFFCYEYTLDKSLIAFFPAHFSHSLSPLTFHCR